MINNNVVSVWIGKCASERQLYEYIDATYDESDEYFPSKFMMDFGINPDDLDEDFIEKVFRNISTNNFAKLLGECSYYESIIKNDFQCDCLSDNFNAIVLIYNYPYKGDIRQVNNFFFFGNIPYTAN